MRNPVYNLRITEDSKKFLSNIKDEYGAEAGLNRFIEALGQFCMTGEAEINGVQIRQFFEDALAGRLVSAGSKREKLRAAEEREYAAYSKFLESDFGVNLLSMMCDLETAAEFFQHYPDWIIVLQKEFKDFDDGLPLRSSVIQRYTSRWYQEAIADGSAALMLKDRIEEQNKKRLEKLYGPETIAPKKAKGRS